MDRFNTINLEKEGRFKGIEEGRFDGTLEEIGNEITKIGEYKTGDKVTEDIYN